MGYWSDQQLKMTEGGMDLGKVSKKFVCPGCFENDAIKAVVIKQAEREKCDYCSTKSKHPIAANLGEIVGFLLVCIEQEWTDADGALPRDDETNDWLIDTPIDTEEPIVHGIGLSLPRDKNDILRSDIIGTLPDRSWCPIDPLRISRHQAIKESWRLFCRVIKHERRFFFRDYSSDKLTAEYDSHEAEFGIGELLGEFAAYCERAGLFATRSADSSFFRCRTNGTGRKLLAREVGPPPIRYAKQANRMSPAGIPMFYGAETAKTALAETVGDPGVYAIGLFQVNRELTLLHLTKAGPVPSLFDLERARDRSWARFMQDFIEDFQKPITRDDRAHIEYVPTQVVTEYFRTVVKVGERRVDGILYSSTREAGGVAVVLFADTFDVTDDEPDSDFKKVRGAFERMDRDEPWLEMTEYFEETVNPEEV